MNRVVVAAAQLAPEYHNLDAAVKKAEKAVMDAAKQGAKLVVFPETWLQGYPYWASISVRDPRFSEFRRLLDQCAIGRDSTAMATLCKIAATAGCSVVMGFHERDGGSLYNSSAYISDTGSLQAVHRKLIPTTTERLVWGRGDGSDLEPVAFGQWRLGGLICFEHQMAAARLALGNLNINVHAALWPGHAFIDGVIDASTRQLAHENGCFVVVAREPMSAERLGADFPDVSDEPDRWEAHGGSAIIGPLGNYIVEPVFDKEELIYGEINLDEIADAKWWFDGSGHYTRPDVFQLHWHRDRKPNMT